MTAKTKTKPNSFFSLEKLHLPPKVEVFVKAHAHIIEQTLVAIIAILALVYIAQLASAADTELQQEILPAASSVTVTSPNGGEDWQVGSSQNITWTSTGTIANVKIELQRTPAGMWEIVTASTPNDGTYPWVVTGSATTTAKIRISDVTDAGTIDESDAVFTISAAPVVTTPISGGSSGSVSPLIDNLYYTDTHTLIKSGDTLFNDQYHNLTIEGRNFLTGATVYVNGFALITTHIDSEHLTFELPRNFAVGHHLVVVKNPSGATGIWGNLLNVANPPEIAETPGALGQYAAKLVTRSTQKITMEPGATTKVWVEFENIGTLDWTSHSTTPVRLATTHPVNRDSWFADNTWISKTRVMGVTDGNGESPASIKPGERGRFEFTLRAPQEIGKYREYFALVVEPTYFFWDNDLRWEIEVVPKDLYLHDQTETPITPGAETPTEPTGAMSVLRNFFILALDFVGQYWYLLLLLALAGYWLYKRAEDNWSIPVAPVCVKKRKANG